MTAVLFVTFLAVCFALMIGASPAMIPGLQPHMEPIRTANKLFPQRNGKHPHPNTLLRWSLSGVRGVKLRTVMIGGVRFTSRQWISEFITATSLAGAL